MPELYLSDDRSVIASKQLTDAIAQKNNALAEAIAFIKYERRGVDAEAIEGDTIAEITRLFLDNLTARLIAALEK